MSKKKKAENTEEILLNSGEFQIQESTEKAVEEIVKESVENSEKSSCIPPISIKRNEYGLICDGSINYIYDENGFINWRAMVNPKFLVPNRQYFEKYNKPVPKSIEGLADRELLILLGGVRELGQTRGYTSVQYEVTSPTTDYVVATCKIKWIPNYETEGRGVEFSAIGDASPFNTTSFAKNFLGPIAENRAFIRCVRNFLKINIVSQEEICPTQKETNNVKMSTNVLDQAMSKNEISFEDIRNYLIKENYIDSDGKAADKYITTNDIPNEKQFELISIINSGKMFSGNSDLL